MGIKVFNADFYPRSPCGERPVFFIVFNASCSFLSTLSLRRATSANFAGSDNSSNFYPRSPCGERLGCDYPLKFFKYFYPRSPCGERPLSRVNRRSRLSPFLSTLSLRRATCAFMSLFGVFLFLSTLSLRRATCGRRVGLPVAGISIHALLAESDVISKPLR